MRALALALALSLTGCYVGPLGMVVAGTVYDHHELDAADLVADDSREWRTRIVRTWGTNVAEFAVDTESERGSVGGAGISSNLQKTLGEDVIKTAVEAAIKAMMPVP